MSKLCNHINSDKFIAKRTIDTGPFSRTLLASYIDNQELYAQRVLTDINDENKEKFSKLCDKLFGMHYPCSIQPSFVSPFDSASHLPPAIFTPYSEKQSMKTVVQMLENGEMIEEIDLTQKLIIIYGILTFLDSIHSKNLNHGRLKLSNVLLDSNFNPYVSDAFLYELNADNPLNNDNIKMLDYIVSLPPEVFMNKTNNEKSDIYSLGILILQIINEKINVFSDLTSNTKEILQFKQNYIKPNISITDQKLKNIIDRCLEFDPKNRPATQEIIIKIDEILSDETKYDVLRFNKFKSLNQTENILLSSELIEKKKLADNGNIEMMYEYGRSRFLGEKCTKNINEALKYVEMAAKLEHDNAQFLLTIIKSLINSKIEQKIQKNNKNEKEISVNDHKKDKLSLSHNFNFIHLKDDPFFTRKKTSLIDIINKIKNNYNLPPDPLFDITKYTIKGFIYTEWSINRLTLLHIYLEIGIPVILEGPTGTSKTLSAEIICEITGRHLIRFNLSSETKPSYLLGRYYGNKKSWAGISMKMGPFLEAFQKGYTILLDEINLASEECLQFIEEALDSGMISVDIPGMPLTEITMDDNFRIIATQNPNKGNFAHKRHDWGLKFISRFQVISFPEFEVDEYKKIVEGLCKSFKYDASEEFINDFVTFHMEWSTKDSIQKDIQCFTIREISATISALAANQNIYDTIMTIYGARYFKKQKEELRSFFLSFDSFKDLKPANFQYPEHFPPCYHNKNLEDCLKSIFFSFENNRHVIITGKEGSGITQIAKWVAKCYDEDNSKIDEDGSKNGTKFCVCTRETKCPDLIGHQIPSKQVESGQELIVWESGFLTDAIEEGRCAVLDNINEAPSTVSERLNVLLDEKYDGVPKMFEIPENPQGKSIKIHSKFRLLCTCRIENIDHMSPAFINRFDIVALENQLEDISDDELKELIKIMMKIKVPVPIKTTDKQNNSKDNEKEKIFSDDDQYEYDDYSADDIEIVVEDGDEEPATPLADASPIEDPTPKSSELDQNYFIPTKALIDLVFSVYNKSSTIYKLSLLCKSISKMIQFVDQNTDSSSPKIQHDVLVKFVSDLIFTPETVEKPLNVPKEIQEFFIDQLFKSKSQECHYFFNKSPDLCQFLSKFYASSIMNLPLCVYGPTGVGKTTAARDFASRRKSLSKSNIPFLMHSFHFGTRPNHFYGSSTIKNGKVEFVNGTLTKAARKGYTFIADEMNLSNPSTMEALAPVLEQFSNEKIYIPGLNEPVVIDNDFFFVACQNDVGTMGRNAIPSSISQRFKVLYYPIQQKDDISNICLKIAQSLYDINEHPSFTEDEARKIGLYMINLNENKDINQKWSLRDITKIFKRIHYQDKYHSNYINLNIYYNILFYTMAPIEKQKQCEALDKVLDLIGNTYVLDANKRNELKECFKSTPTLKSENKISFLMKGKIGISTSKLTQMSRFENFKIELFSCLPTILDSIFQVLLTDADEPILLTGPSGYKTFLSQLFLSDSVIVSLTRETSVSQLIGTSTFLTYNESKLFYLDLICKICHIYNPEDIIYLKEKLKTKQLKKEDIDTRINAFNSQAKTFPYAIENLTKKLFEDNIDERNRSILSDMIIEFKPGIVLSAILEGKSTIFKDITNLPTIVLERFNELFSGEHNLTLNEDYHDTFTSNDKKELTNFNSTYRAFATCALSTLVKLSEAVRSRFTVIFTPQYLIDELGSVLLSYNILFKKNLSEELIKIIIEFSKSAQKIIGKTLTFPQMINILEICSKVNSTSLSQKDLLTIVLYRIFVGLLDKRWEYLEKIKTIFASIGLTLPELILNPRNENPFNITNKNGIKGLESKITGIFIDSIDITKNHPNVEFTKQFIDMLDIIHLGLSARVPIIFEGNPGQGIDTAIHFASKQLGYNIVNYILSKATKVDDILGKITIESDDDNNIHVKTIHTTLAKAIANNAEYNRTIFVFHNLNIASPGVLEKLSSLLDRNQINDQKCQINAIGIFYSQNSNSNREKLSSSLMYSAVYHIVDNPKKNDVKNIINTLFQQHEFKYEGEEFFVKYKIAQKLARQNNASPAITLHDISKYIHFRSCTNGIFNKKFIYQMLFGYRFLQQETIDKVLQKLNLHNMNFQPLFLFNEEKKEIYIKESYKSKSLVLKMAPDSNVDIEKIKLELKSLTIAQQQCLLFLAFTLISKLPCIIQGKTASGKSYIIMFFAQMIGQKIHVCQLNKETGISILTGQSVLSDQLTEADIQEFLIAFNDLQTFEELKLFINENISKDPKKWEIESFRNLLNEIKDYKNEHKELSEEKNNLLLSAENRIRKTMSPAKRFHKIDSCFIRAMENGEWILLDGIESAPPEIAEKLSSLCGDNPEIDLFECGEKYYFSRNNPKGRKIHENFHLFVTYNPSSKIGSKTLDPIFLNKCPSFTLPAIDSTPSSSSQVLIGSMIKTGYDNEFSVDIGQRIANAHQYAKHDSEIYRDSYAGDLQFTGRTLNFIIKEFKHHFNLNATMPLNNMDNVLRRILNLYYWNSYINDENKEKFKKIMIDELSKDPQQKSLTINIEDINPKNKYEPLLTYLRNIQLYSCEMIKEPNINFSEIIMRYNQVQITDLSFITKHLEDTLNIIWKKCSIKEEKNLSILENQYSQVQIMFKIFCDIKKGKKSLNSENLILPLIDEKVENNVLLSINELERPISRLILLFELIKKNDICITNPYKLYDDDLIDLLKIIINMSLGSHLNNFNYLISKLNQNNELMKIIDDIFPYHLFRDKPNLKWIIFWLPKFKQLFESKITFHIICHEEYDFISHEYKGIEPTYIFKEPDSLCISIESKFVSHKEGGKKMIPKPKADKHKDQLEILNRKFYQYTNALLKHHPQTISDLNNKTSSRKPKPSKSTTHYPCISKFYLKDMKDTFISKVWSLLYNFSSETINILITILHPIESNILQIIEYFYNNINKNNINQITEFTNRLTFIGNQQSRLWVILNNDYSIDNIDDLIQEKEQIKNEIQNIKNLPKLDEKLIKLWNPEKYIDELQNKLNIIEFEILQKRNGAETACICNELKLLTDELDSIIITNEDMKFSKEKIIQYINGITSPTKDDLDHCKKKVDQFHKLLKNDDKILTKFIWPNYTRPNYYIKEESLKTKLYEHVIWFSRVKAVINKICDPNNTFIFKDIMDLIKFKEMRTSSELLLNQYFKVKNNQKLEIDPYDKDSLNSTLNAQFLYKLQCDKLIQYVVELDKVFNDLSLRNEIKNEYELQWIHQRVNDFEPNLNLVLPDFIPSDLLYLFIGYSGNKENLSNGPIVSTIECDVILTAISKIMFNRHETFIECADLIAQNIYRIVFNDTSFPKSHDEIKKQLKDEYHKYRAMKIPPGLKEGTEYKQKIRNESLINAALITLDLSESLNSIKNPYKFTHDDDGFLQPNWMKNTEFINKYPSFVYWLIKNQRYAQPIQEMYSKLSFNEKCLPFWMFALRIMSSQNCIMLDIDSSTTISEKITQKINECIQRFIRSKGMKNLGIDWLSLVLSNVPSEIIVPNYRMFYDFFIYLSKEKDYSEIINERRNKSIVEFTENVCNMVFNKEINAFLEKPFGDLNDNNLAFINNPSNYIKQKIEAYRNQNFIDFLQSSEFKEHQANSRIEEELVDKINLVSQLINEQNEIKKNQFNRTNFEKMKSELIDNIKEYNSILTNLQSNYYRKLKDFMRLTKKLNELKKEMTNVVFKINDPLIIYRLNWYERIDLNLVFDKKITKIKFIDKEIYLQQSAKEIFQIKTTGNVPYEKYNWIQESFYLINETECNIDQICTEKMNQTYISVPTLIFGSKISMNPESFISKIKLASKHYSTLLNDIRNIIQNGNINDATFAKPKKYINEFRDIIPILAVKFTNDDKCEIIQNILDQIRQIFSQIFKYTCNFNSLLEKRIYKIWKSLPKMDVSQKLFNYNYQLPYPSQEKISNSLAYNITFKNLEKTDFLSLPILSIDKDEENQNIISCCFKTLDCCIGPVIPSLYKGQWAINFISFIDSPVSVKIDIEESCEDKNSANFSYRELIQPGDPFQIFISLPQPIQEYKEFSIPAIITIKSSDLKKLEQPCNFQFKLAPLSVLIYSKEYNLSLIDQMIYLCVQDPLLHNASHIVPNSEITFVFQSFYVKEILNPAHQFIDFDDNQAEKPDVKFNQNEMILHFKNTDSVAKLHFILLLKFSESLSTKILFDTAIIPFEFGFEIYDYNNKQYTSNYLTVYYSSQFIDREIILHCKIFASSFSSKINANIFNNFSGLISVISCPKNLQLDNDTEFDIVLKINNTISNNYYFITVKIGQQEKKIYLRFEEPKMIYDYRRDYRLEFNSRYFNIPHIYGYNWKTKDWQKINSISDNTNDITVIVSPFHTFDKKYQSAIPEIKYSQFLSKKINTTIEISNCSNNIFISLTDKGLPIPNQCSKININALKSTFIFGKLENYWYPLFDDYDSKFESFDILEIADCNIKRARINLDNMPSNFMCSSTSFTIWASLMKEYFSVIENLPKLLEMFPESFHENEFDTELNNLISFIPELYDNYDFLPIVQNNLIYIFYRIFQKRFKEIIDNGNKIPTLVNKAEVSNKATQSYLQYIEIDNFALNREISTETSKRIKKIKKNVATISPSIVPAEQYEAFMISENNELPKPYSKADIPSYLTHSTSQNSFSADKIIDVTLPTINIPTKSEFNQLSILSLNQFYQICTEATRVFPIYVKNMLIQDSPEMIANAKEYFLKLLQIYTPLPTTDYSFIAKSVNEFSYGFASMVDKFEKAKVDFGSLVPKKHFISEQNQEFVQKPRRNQVILPQDIWKSYKAYQSTAYQGEIVIPAGQDIFISNQLKINIDNHPITNINSNSDEPTQNSEPAPKMEVEYNDDDDVNNDEMAKKVFVKQYDNLHNDNMEEEDLNNDNFDAEYDDFDQIAVPDTNGPKEEISIKKQNFDDLLLDFKESDGIERAISRMMSIDPEKKFIINSSEPHPYNEEKYKMPDYVDIPINQYPILHLINQSYIISRKFIEIATELDLPYSTLCANILIDCCKFISKENKLYNMMIICALTDALTTLGIPYSVSVIADKNFKCIIKPFDESHSIEALQKICDCYLIERFSCELPECVKYAIEKMEYKGDARKNRAIFTFTNGLDDKLVALDIWNDLFKSAFLSFGFIFIKSSELNEENTVFLEDIWDKFEKSANENENNSVVKIAKIAAEWNIINSEGEVSDVVNLLVELFANVIKRSVIINESNSKINRKYAIPSFDLKETKKLNNLTNFKQFLTKTYNQSTNIFVKRTDILRKASSTYDQLDSKLYDHKLNQILSCEIDESLKNDYPEFLKYFIENTNLNNNNSMEAIFKPNKASQTILSSTGTDFDITALILYLINPVPDPLIYIEEKGGLVCNYGVTIVIDASYSCFNGLSGPHSFQTIRSILSSLSNIDLPCLDLIIATDESPIVLCSEVKTLYALNDRSRLWNSLFTVLQNSTKSMNRADLASAIHTAFDLRRMRSLQCTSILLVLTDGLYEEMERNRIVECVNYCVQSGVNTYGIGIGIYPKGIEKLFPQIVFAENPSNTMKGIAMLCDENYYNFSETMNCLGSRSFDSNELTEGIKLIIEKNKEHPIFESLVNELSNITAKIESFRDFMNIEEIPDGKITPDIVNPTGKCKELYIENFLKTQKILIVQFCDDTVCGDTELMTKHIFENKDSTRRECINEAVKFFGISLEVVQNYEDAIHEITKSTTEFCDYYAVWVICGSDPEKLPTGQRDSNKYLVEQFTDVLIQFWRNGGSVVYWADNDPYTFHVNVFLNRITFENEKDCPTGKVTFQIHGDDHPGGEMLDGDLTGELNHKKLFNKKIQQYDELQRATITNNIFHIYEGKTLSYVNININDENYKEKLLPFQPLAIDSNGGITSLFYKANLKTKTGDIVIDCGLTKLFYELTSEGTYRLIQNIAGWTARPEVHMHIDKTKPWEWRPKAVHYTIPNITSPNYSEFVKNLKANSVIYRKRSLIIDTVRRLGGDVECDLRFSIQWNDLGDWDKNDLDAHCIEPNGFEIMYNKKKSPNTDGELDVDIINPKEHEEAAENIRFKNKSSLQNGTYQFFVHQYSYREGKSGFIAEIEFDKQSYFYEYRNVLPQSSNVYVAKVTYNDGHFTIQHDLKPI